MPRMNFKNVEKLVAEATAIAVTRLAAERKVDADHIAEHVRASQDAINRLEALESMVRDLIVFEKERLNALQGHHEDINNDEPALIEAQPVKRLNGA